MRLEDMTDPITRDELMLYLDGELPPDERLRVDTALERSTELQRELAIFRSMKGDVQSLELHKADYHRSVWDDVNTRLTRPVGWILLVAGLVVWSLYGTYLFATGPADVLEKLATGAVAIGILLLLASVIFERYREWLTDPYRDVYK